MLHSCTSPQTSQTAQTAGNWSWDAPDDFRMGASATIPRDHVTCARSTTTTIRITDPPGPDHDQESVVPSQRVCVRFGPTHNHGPMSSGRAGAARDHLFAADLASLEWRITVARGFRDKDLPVSVGNS